MRIRGQRTSHTTFALMSLHVGSMGRNFAATIFTASHGSTEYRPIMKETRMTASRASIAPVKRSQKLGRRLCARSV